MLHLKKYAIPAPVEVQRDLPKKASMHVTRMHLDVRMRSKRSNAPPETAARAPTRMPCRRERRRSARLLLRPDAERYVHTVRDLMVPMGDIEVGIGSHSLAGESPKGRFSPREAPSAAVARCSPEVEIAIRCRAARPRPSRTPCEVGPTTARHPQCPFSPSGQGVETGRSAL